VRVSVVGVDEQSAGTPPRMLDDQTGSDVIDESKRKMALLRLGRSRWDAGPHRLLYLTGVMVNKTEASTSLPRLQGPKFWPRDRIRP